MTRDEFMELVYETFDGEPDNVLANGIIQAADDYAESMLPEPCVDAISRQAAIDAVKERYYKYDRFAKIEELVWSIENLPSAQPEYIQNNAVHLCDSCQYTYATCPSHGNDAVFGDGKDNGNICACNKYRPISAQPEQKKGGWMLGFNNQYLEKYYYCSHCGRRQYIEHKPLDNFCPNCGAEMRKEKE